MSCTIDATEFKAFFDRGQFMFGATSPYAFPEVRDADIVKAITEAEAIFNGDLYPPDTGICEQALNYLTAHFVQLDLETIESGGQTKLLQTSRSADGISESLSIPEWMNAGEFAFYATTYYGQKFLIISKPYLDGGVFSVPGRTSP